MRFLIFQHINIEHPGVFREFMAEDDVECTTVELDEGESIPSFDGYDALWVMGGPQKVWQEDKYPWLREEKAAIRAAIVKREMPFLGLCLGHQLLAETLGGEVGLMTTPEVGILEVELTPAGQADPVLAGFDSVGPCLQWHEAEVTRTPPGAEVLVSSPICAVQAMRVGERAYSFQYHLEPTKDTVPQWGCVPSYEKALEETLGKGALARLETEMNDNLPTFRTNAKRLYDNFKTLI